jgi:hypothetical protein
MDRSDERRPGKARPSRRNPVEDGLPPNHRTQHTAQVKTATQISNSARERRLCWCDETMNGAECKSGCDSSFSTSQEKRCYYHLFSRASTTAGEAMIKQTQKSIEPFNNTVVSFY